MKKRALELVASRVARAILHELVRGLGCLAGATGVGARWPREPAFAEAAKS